MTPKIRVLLADDTLIAREGWRRILDTDETVEVVGEVVLAQEVVQRARQLTPDVVLLDLYWFDDDSAGISAIRQIKQAGLPVKIVAITAWPHLVALARNAGAEAVLPKGFSREELIAAIRSAAQADNFPAPAAELPPLEPLSDRELEVLRLLAQGLEDKEIATALNIAYPTARNHVANLSDKLGARNRTHAVALGYAKGLIDLD